MFAWIQNCSVWLCELSYTWQDADTSQTRVIRTEGEEEEHGEGGKKWKIKDGDD